MAQDTNLLFVGRTGNAIAPIIPVTDDSGAAVDLSSVGEITVSLFVDPNAAAVLVKKKSTNGVTWPQGENGTQGRFQVQISNNDAKALKGFLRFVAEITDAQGNITDVVDGRCQFGPFPDWSYSGDPKANDKDMVRFLVHDTDANDPLVSDAEIAAAIATRFNVNGAAAMVCRSLAAFFSRDVDSSSRDQRENYSQRANAFKQRANELEQLSAASQFGAIPTSGLLKMF